MFDGIGGVKAKAASTAGSWWQELAPLIKPNGIDTKSSAFCEFANLKSYLQAILNARHEYLDMSIRIHSGVESRVKRMREALPNQGNSPSSVPHHQFPASLIRLHHSMSLANLIKAKNPCRFSLVAPGRRPLDDGLERDI